MGKKDIFIAFTSLYFNFRVFRMSFRSVSKKHILGDYDVIEPPKIGVNGVGAGVPHNFLKSMYKKSPLS